MKRVISLVLTALLSLVALVAVGVPAAEATAGPVKVVSLGDSFAAGSTLDPAYSETVCDRSSLSYPYLLKKFSQSPMVDVACGGATTSDLFGPQVVNGTSVPAQILAVSSSAKVVTLTIGGNDVGFSQLAWCLANALTISDPTMQAIAESACLQPLSIPGAFSTELYGMAQRLTAALLAIQAKAPEAQIFVSDYPIILGLAADGTCPEIPQVPASLVGTIDAANAQVNATIGGVVAAAAGAVHVTFVDVAPSFAGHGLCSTTPLINGLLHPTAQGQQVYADVFNASIKTTFAA